VGNPEIPVLAYSEAGWEGMKPDESPVKDAAQRRYDGALLVARPFMSPEGQSCLQKLREQTIHAPTWSDGLGLLNGIATGFAREGQNSIIRHIENCIRIAQEGPPKEA